MYVVMVYDTNIDGFKPYRTATGTALSFEEWSEAAEAALSLSRDFPNDRFKVWYNTVRSKKARAPRAGKVVRKRYGQEDAPA